MQGMGFELTILRDYNGRERHPGAQRYLQSGFHRIPEKVHHGIRAEQGGESHNGVLRPERTMIGHAQILRSRAPWVRGRGQTSRGSEKQREELPLHEDLGVGEFRLQEDPARPADGSDGPRIRT